MNVCVCLRCVCVYGVCARVCMVCVLVHECVVLSGRDLPVVFIHCPHGPPLTTAAPFLLDHYFNSPTCLSLCLSVSLSLSLCLCLSLSLSVCLCLSLCLSRVVITTSGVSN